MGQPLSNAGKGLIGKAVCGGRKILFLTLFILLSVAFAGAQCIDHPRRKTALRFSNESRFELTFFVDDDEKGVIVRPKTVTGFIKVEPGEHMLRARAILRGKSFWVWTINEVPDGQICTWTVEDPRHGGGGSDQTGQLLKENREKEKQNE